MSYFSRLTDIVTCNLTEILAREADPLAAVEEIISEMQEGLAGATRSVETAQTNADRLSRELDEHQEKVEYWTGRARDELQTGNEEQARLALVRKQEVADLIAGLRQQQEAAVATRDHLTTMLRALEARLADAKRRQRELRSGSPVEATASSTSAGVTPADSPPSLDAGRTARIDAELKALKKELGGG